jgi:hypothetical protein
MKSTLPNAVSMVPRIGSHLLTVRHHLAGGLVYRGMDMPYRNEAAAVLSMWRDIDRVLTSVPPESDEARDLLDEWARLRIEYARLAELAREQHRPLPEPWPGP